MSNNIILKKSSVGDKVPLVGDLQHGELALNFTDGNLFYKNNSNVVTTLASNKFVSVTGNVTGSNLVGTLNGSGANVTAINGTNITTGTIAAARIADLDAAKVTTGVFADARIPNLNASKITAGTLAVTRGGTGVTTSTGTGATVRGTSPSFVTQITVPQIAKSGTTGVGNIGAAGSTFNTVFAKATSAQYADVAERYQADADYAPGTVLIIGGSHEVTAATQSHDHRAAGVVSENPSYLMNSALDTVNSVAVGLLGRVPCQVIGPISRGDLLTTSTVPGTACRLDPAKYLPGCVIGKALQEYHGEHPGTIEIAVGVK